jgi:membrane protease YdiL (CAAX protease family)
LARTIDHPAQKDRTAVPTSAILPFLLLTFAVTWVITGFYVLAPGRAAAWFGPMSGTHPLFVLATWGPAIAALVLVSVQGGAGGLRAFLSRLTMWRVRPALAAFVAIGLPLVFIAGSLIKGGPLLTALPPEGVLPLFAIMAFMLVLGPVEELGWRGFLQPLLQRLMAPLWAGMLIGAIWGLWHVPAFLMAGTVQSGWTFGPFFLGNVALSVVVTPLLNRSGGGLLWPVLFHWQLINPFWPDA